MVDSLPGDDGDAGADAAPEPPVEDAGAIIEPDAGKLVCTRADLVNAPTGSDPDCWCSYIECARAEREMCQRIWLACEERAHCMLLEDDPPVPAGVDESCWCVYLQCEDRGQGGCTLDCE